MTTIGIDVGGTNIKAVLTGRDRCILAKLSLPTYAERGPDVVIGQLHAAVEGLLEHASRDDLSGIGIGAPGSVDFERGMILHPPNLPGWEEVPVVALMRDRWQVPVRIDNDANCAALGEAYFGAGRRVAHFVGITLGTGVGSGIIIDRKIYHGEKGYGGEFGHTSIDYNGPPCGCGNFGCIEAYLGNSYLVANARERILHHPESPLYALLSEGTGALTPRHISEAAADADPVAFDILYDAGFKLGIAIANAANLLDITTFIIGGGVSAAGKPLFDGIAEGANGRALKVHRGFISILPAALGNDAGMLGAASLLATP
jgi:glucokinase